MEKARIKPGYVKASTLATKNARRSRKPLIVLSPRIHETGSISENGRMVDLIGFARAVVVMCGERVLREIDDPDNARRRSLCECADYWHKVASDCHKVAPGNARQINPQPEAVPIEGEKVLPFNLGAFKRRVEPDKL